MKKIIFILLTVFAAATNAFAADKPIKWKLAETWPANFPIYGEATKEFAKRVEEMSNGRLIISIDSANKHKSALGIFDFVKSGQYQMGHSASYYWKGKDINTLFFTTMPFGMISAERTAWYHNGGGAELAKRAYSKHGITQYPAGSGSQMGGWFKKEINSVDDLKGLKMRIPGFAGEVLAKVGATVTNVPPGELYTSLERNTIDALEWVGPSFDLRMGFHKIAQYYYTGWHEPGSEIQFMVNNEAFDKLPKDLQAILKAAMRESETSVTDRLYYENGANWEKIKNEFPNIKVKTFPPDVMAALREANKELVDKLEEQGGLTAEIIESQRKFKKQVREWTNISDKAYLNN
ncbi:TRAP transporter substrate-binding protein [Cocleimonas flava]|uniref:TRAP-type mannitol/chloroaromatic compound transport system substrate-binding protein n=1 Tax=Cocleimonas flava TaxID=634765 RepID=A0A4R1FC07_9GAMM|nr:TRAP transporter substrate-binding protein [Cocleimonas flava]TCJ88291.1 TRAP-type mannitol/chloroaromatic compound transport system substrate-binding protein [Cocleimonas flava]